VAAADAFVFVTPEYNFGMPPALANAFDFLYHEWCYKAAGFVSYGGISGGTRSANMAKQIMTALKIMPIPESVILPFVARSIEGGQFVPVDTNKEAATKMLDELLRWNDALKTLRTA
jgi:NAD(P)H-dependent FMN reductase